MARPNHSGFHTRQAETSDMAARVPLLRILLAAIIGVSTLFVGTALTNGASAAVDAGAESEFGRRTNQTRSGAGLGTLASADDLVAVARRHSQDMANRGQLYHNPNLGSQVSNWVEVGENVGMGPSAAVIQDAFMR